MREAGVFPLGEDALRLGEFATVRPRWRVCDLGTGSGILLVLLAQRESTLALTGVEIDPLSARTARENLISRQLCGEIFCESIETVKMPGQFDLVISNPPYFPKNSGKGESPFRMEQSAGLADFCAAAGGLLRNGGRFALCHRPERLADLFAALRASGLEPKRMKLVSPKLVLLESVKQGRPGLHVEMEPDLPQTESGKSV